MEKFTLLSFFHTLSPVIMIFNKFDSTLPEDALHKIKHSDRETNERTDKRMTQKM